MAVATRSPQSWVGDYHQMMSRWLGLMLFALAIASACSGSIDSTQELAPATRLGSHLFVPVGETRSLAGLGEHLETIHLTDPPAVSFSEDTVSAVNGRISCFRFRYREHAAENGVQSPCVIVFDETGSCDTLPRIELDLQMFLGPTSYPVGEANLLASGTGRF
jgi:hypothetical protein